MNLKTRTKRFYINFGHGGAFKSTERW